MDQPLDGSARMLS